MSYAELVEWKAFHRIHPFGEPAEWSRHARITRQIYDLHRTIVAALGGDRPPSLTIDDFIPDFGSDT